jgi:hypothetical protein
MIWHILRKDLNRLRLPVALVLALLTALALLDAWRYDFEAGLAETVLNIVLPLAWSLLIAVAVQLEPMTSDTAFWLTRPYRRSALLAAKLLLAGLAIHLPLLIAQSSILLSHGFSPFEPELLWTQALVLFGVTLPALAIASVTTTIAGFGWCALAAGAVALTLNAALVGRRYPWTQSDWMPGVLALLLVAAGAAVMVGLQYTRRTHWFARAVGVAVAAGAVLIFSFVPRDLTAVMQCSLEPDPSSAMSVDYEPNAGISARPGWVPPDRAHVSVPLRINGVGKSDWVLIEQIRLRLASADGRSWEVRRDLGPERYASLAFDPAKRFALQYLLPERSFIQAVAGDRVRVDGRVTIHRLHSQNPIVLPSVFDQTDVAGLGRCSAAVSVAMFGREMLKVVCESPGKLPVAPVTLIDPETGREWRQGLGDSANFRMIPAMDWLSPLQRRQTFLQVVDNDTKLAGDRWLVPRHVLARSTIRIEPAVKAGCANVEYSFELPDIRKWVTQPAAR